MDEGFQKDEGFGMKDKVKILLRLSSAQLTSDRSHQYKFFTLS